MYFYTNVFSRGDKIFVRGVQNGKRFKEVIDYKPYLFVPSPNGEYKTLNNKAVEKIEFPSIRDAHNFSKKYENIDNFEIYGLTNFQYLYLYDEFQGTVEYDVSEISIVGIDIETPTDQGFPDPKTAAAPISNITINKGDKIVVFGFEYYKPKLDNVHYVLCKDEKDMLIKFIEVWSSWAPDVVTGWNIDHFDIPYLVNRISIILGDSWFKKLSPWNIVNKKEIVRGKSVARAGKQITQRVDIVFDIAGIVSLDYLELYKKFSFKNQESYKLDYIAKEELDEQKLDYSEFASLYEFYKKDYERFVDYNIHDVVLVQKLEDKLKLIELVFAFAYDAKVNYNDTLTTVRPWDVIIHNYLLDKKIVIPNNERSYMPEHLVGGYVKEPKVGLSNWVVSFDLNSLYPHLIMQYNISPETFMGRSSLFPTIDQLLVSEDKFSKDNCAVTANGCYYNKDKQGFLPALMEKMYNDRIVFKDMMIEAKKRYEKTKDKNEEKLIARYHNLQLAKKIQLNSAYGALGNEYFRWFSFNNAEAITTSGQLSIRWIEKKINAFLSKLLNEDEDYVIASDTDSIYVNFGPLVQKVLVNKTDQEIIKALDDFVEAKIQPYIDKCYQELADKMSAREQKMKMKRETIANKGIWKAKKMYILNAWNVEGVQYDKPRIKIYGIEAVRSSTPASCRTNIKKALEILMNENEDSFQKFIAKFRKDFIKLPFEEVAFPRSVNNLSKYKSSFGVYEKATPQHVKGALLFNDLIRRMNIKNVQPISDGDKIKFAYLKFPNPINDTILAAPESLPKELDMDKYIDRDMQFEKAFLDPLRAITNVIGWHPEKIATLEEFF